MPGTSEADLGRSLFREERYAEAAEHFERALALDPGNPDLTDLLAKASANATAEVDVFVPELRFFDADELLAPPPQPTLPSPRNLPGDPHWRRLRYWVGHTLGNLGGTVFESLMHVVGRRYRGRVWTSWYRKPLYPGILTLAYMREHLDRHNLKSTYPAGRQRRLRTAGPHPAGGRDPLPHRRWLVEQPGQPEGGRGRHPLPAQRRQLRHPASDRRGGADTEPAPDQPEAAHPGRDHAGGPVPQPPRGVVDPVPEQRLDHPRRDAPARRSSRSPSTRTIPPGSASVRSGCSSAGPSPTRPVGRPASRRP